MVPKKLSMKTSTDEIGEMALATQQLTDGLERTARFANEIGGGNFNASFTKLSNNDKLGQSLIEMRDELRGFHDRELKSTRARLLRCWKVRNVSARESSMSCTMV